MVSSLRQSSDALGPSNTSKPNPRGGNSDTMEWRKPNDEQGAVVRGAVKSRGTGRGGRGAGGRGRGRDHKDVPAVKEAVSAPAAPDPAPSGRTSRQKSRKPSAVPSEDLLRPPTPQTRPPNRRRRSHQSISRVATASPNLAPNKFLTVDTGGRKAVTGPPTPAGNTKDLPPHLVPPASASHDLPSFDLRTNIDALVERVRAVAMDRPHTPGSHIDWAGDDDDSLPDLDDWAVPSSQVEAISDDQEETSPISMPASVPEDNSKPIADSATVDSTSRPHKVEKVRSKRGTRSRGNSRTQPVPPALELTPNSPVSTRQQGGLSAMTATQNTVKPDLSQPSTAKLHPSLPPKPLTPVEPSRPRTNNIVAATSMRTTLPPKPVTHPATLIQVEGPKPVADHKEDHKEREKEVIQPLIPVLEPPSHRTFNPSHGRAHTMSRMMDVRPPHSAPTSTFPHQSLPADLAFHSPLRSAGVQHSRNHSSPPVTRAPHATRPVLTGDALTRLARTLGTGGGMSPRREPLSVAPVKD